MATETEILDEKMKIDGDPTKEFFIFMLTKDIDLKRAIADLVDNSVDGARRLRPNGNYKGLFVEIEANADRFSIRDNCGGIDVNVARKYAFRFGRPKDAPEMLKHSIGQFGVGMKRALFKMGRIFAIESTTKSSTFTIPINTDVWARKPDKWDFVFKTVDENYRLKKGEEPGTTIEVTKLHSSIAEEFASENFQKRMNLDLAADHQFSINGGLTISLNKVALKHATPSLLVSRKILPAFQTIILNGAAPKVNVRLYAGIGESDPKNAGWSIFCNDRMILGGDRTIRTGWGEEGVPSYHNEYARFKGYVLFDSDRADALPWNTTKSGVDMDSTHYRNVRAHMISAMRPVIDFMSRVAREKKRLSEDDESQYERIIQEAKPAELESVKKNSKFQYPVRKITTEKSNMANIQYQRSHDQVEVAKSVLKVSKASQVGERTFDYFFNRECK